MSTLITYDWLAGHGWHVLPRRERQPDDHMVRWIGVEIIGDLFMQAPEDLGIELAPVRRDGLWYCWLTMGRARNMPPHTWIHCRHLRTTDELVLLYEGLTGRRFHSAPLHHRENWGQPLFKDSTA